MAIVPYPVNPSHQRVKLQPITAAQVNKSEYTGNRQALDLGYSWRTAEVAVSAMTIAEARAWRLFSGRVRGPVNSFRLPVLNYAQHDLSYTARAQGASSDPYALATDGWPVSTTALLGGDYVTVGEQLMMLDEDVVSNGSGQATLVFHEPLRGTVADNTVIETKRPWLLSSFPENAPALSLGLIELQEPFSFSVEEAY